MKHKSAKIVITEGDLNRRNPVAKALASNRFRQRRIEALKPSFRAEKHKKRFMRMKETGHD